MSEPANNRLFISCVSDEFEKPAAAFPGFRSLLRHYLTRADCEVKVQEDFRQAVRLALSSVRVRVPWS